MAVYYKVNPNHLKESINSILKQTYKPSQFIIVKDGMLTKEQNEVIEDYKKDSIIETISIEKNQGSGNAYNQAIDKCKYPYAAIMDSDDIADEKKFEKQIKYISTHPDIDAIGTNAIEFLGKKENVVSTRIMPEKNEDIIKFGHARCPMIQPTVLFKVDSVKAAGSYQHSPLTEDFDLYIRMIMKGCKFYTYQEVLYYIRTNEEFFRRRGGLKYLKTILDFKYKWYKKGYFTFFQFLKTSISSIAVSLMPNKMRVLVYKKFLRN